MTPDHVKKVLRTGLVILGLQAIVFVLYKIDTSKPGVPNAAVASSTVTTAFQQQLHGVELTQVERFALCRRYEEYPDRWNATVLYNNGNIYDYEINKETGAATLRVKSTTAERERDRQFGDQPDYGCIWTWNNRGIVPKLKFTADFGFVTTEAGVAGYVSKAQAEHGQFNDAVVAVLRNAAPVVRLANIEHAAIDAAKKSWGVKP